MNCSLVLLLALGSFAFAQDSGSTVLRGTLRIDPQLEGGVRTLTVNGTTYDLHKLPTGLADGDVIEVRGTPQPHRVCIHMVGIVFHVASARRMSGS